MNAIRQYVDADRLMSIISLPEALRNQKLEIIVLPAAEQVPPKKKQDVDDILGSLLGAIPSTDLTLADLRAERLGKYEVAD